MTDLVAERIADEIARTPTVNTHEHAWQSFCPAWALPYDLPSFIYQGYLEGDLVSAGMPRRTGIFDYLRDPTSSNNPAGAWEMMRPFVERVRNTSYFRYLLAGMRELFGVSESDIFSERWPEVSQCIRMFSFEQLGRGADLCARMNVTATVMDAKLPPEALERTSGCGHRILYVARLDDFIMEARGLEATLERLAPKGLDDWIEAFDRRFDAYLEAGVAGFKSGLAYNRRIEYADPTEGEVAAIFRRGILSAVPLEKTAFQDFMMNRLCRNCVNAGVPLQIHAGIQAGNSGTLEDTRPTGLNSLFLRHPDLRVDLFHGGYPWTVQAGIMAKYFPNVYINGCWLNSISVGGYGDALKSWFELVPMTKIFAWGGDSYPLLEHSYCSLLGARKILADVLCTLVRADYCDLDLALHLARRVLHDNAADFWRLKSD